MALSIGRSFTLERQVSRRLNHEVPRGERSAFINQLIREHFEEET